MSLGGFEYIDFSREPKRRIMMLSRRDIIINADFSFSLECGRRDRRGISSDIHLILSLAYDNASLIRCSEI